MARVLRGLVKRGLAGVQLVVSDAHEGLKNAIGQTLGCPWQRCTVHFLREALGHVRKGGTVVCAGIHMSDIPSFPYELLWGERSVRSVANLTRADGEEFLALAAELPLDVEVETFALEQANDALARLRSGAVRGAAVLVP